MATFYTSTKKILVIHIPKTGGSTVTRFLIDSGFKKKLFPRERVNHLHYNLYKKHVDLDSFDFMFTIYRDPIKRFLSHYKWIQRQTRMNLTADQFCNKILSDYKKNNYVHDNHIRPQHEFICEGMNVYNFNDLSYLPTMLSDKLDFKFDRKLPHEKKSTYLSTDVLSESSIDKLTSFYKEDYSINPIKYKAN